MKHLKLVFFILCIWFVISFITNILGSIIPELIEVFSLSKGMVSFLPFSFFLAYGLMSIPSSFLIERFGEKRTLFFAFSLIFVGSLLFALFPVYLTGLLSLFIIGIGMAMLQVVINPLMRQVGGEEHFAFNSALAQLVFGAASFISPFLFAYLMAKNMPWYSLYWIFTVLIASMLIILSFVRFPQVELKDDEKAGSQSSYIELLKKKYVILYFFGIISYVGTEQGLASWMSQFLKEYHNYDPSVEGASALAWFWGLMSIGCLIGLLILKLFDSRRVLQVCCILALSCVAVALYGSRVYSYYAFPLSGFFISVMFSILFSLALNSVTRYHGSFSGILCTGIFGGALIPLLIGLLGDYVGLRYSMSILFVSLGYIFYLSFWAKPLVNNGTTSLKNILKLIINQMKKIYNYSKCQMWLLVALRWAIGWHFFYEGLSKVLNPHWTAFPYLIDSQGWFSPFFKSLAQGSSIDFINVLNEWGLVLIGVGLILGVFTKLSSWMAILLLSFYYLSHPALLETSSILPSEGSYFLVDKNIIEIIALLVLIVFPTQYCVGIDALFCKKKNK